MMTGMDVNDDDDDAIELILFKGMYNVWSMFLLIYTKGVVLHVSLTNKSVRCLRDIY